MAMRRHWASDAATSASRPLADLRDAELRDRVFNVGFLLGTGHCTPLPPMSGIDPMYGPTVRCKSDLVMGKWSCVNVSGPVMERHVAPGHDGYWRALVLISGPAHYGLSGHQISNAPADCCAIS